MFLLVTVRTDDASHMYSVYMCCRHAIVQLKHKFQMVIQYYYVGCRCPLNTTDVLQFEQQANTVLHVGNVFDDEGLFRSMVSLVLCAACDIIYNTVEPCTCILIPRRENIHI